MLSTEVDKEVDKVIILERRQAQAFSREKPEIKDSVITIGFLLKQQF